MLAAMTSWESGTGMSQNVFSIADEDDDHNIGKAPQTCSWVMLGLFSSSINACTHEGSVCHIPHDHGKRCTVAAIHGHKSELVNVSQLVTRTHCMR